MQKLYGKKQKQTHETMHSPLINELCEFQGTKGTERTYIQTQLRIMWSLESAIVELNLEKERIWQVDKVKSKISERTAAAKAVGGMKEYSFFLKAIV